MITKLFSGIFRVPQYVALFISENFQTLSRLFCSVGDLELKPHVRHLTQPGIRWFIHVVSHQNQLIFFLY